MVSKIWYNGVKKYILNRGKSMNEMNRKTNFIKIKRDKEGICNIF